MSYLIRRHLQLIVVILLLAVAGLGLLLTLRTGTHTDYLPVTNQYAVCGRTISTSLFSYSEGSYECPVLAGGWAQGTLHAKSASSVIVSVAATGQIFNVVYSSNGTYFHFLLPMAFNGTIQLRISNLVASANKINGTIQSYQLTSVVTPVPTITHPYRTSGLAVAATAGGVLALVLLDPGQKFSSAFQRAAKPPGVDKKKTLT